MGAASVNPTASVMLAAEMRDNERAATRPRRIGALDALVALAVAVCASLWDASFHVVPAEGGPWRGMSSAPSALRVLASIAGGAAVAWGTSRFPAAVRRPLVALGAPALAFIPVLTGRVLPLLVLQGGVVRLLAGAVIAVAAVRLAVARGLRVGGAPAPALFAAALVFYSAWGTRVPGAAGPQGDEPHYLVMAQSLLSDGDLDLADEHAAREYAPFYGGTLAPHTSPNTPPDRLYSMHSPGLPVLLLPAYALGGYPGARIFVSALAALFTVLLHRLVRDVTKDESAAVGAWALGAFTPPLPFYAVTLYPETLAALAVVAFLLVARRAPSVRAAAAATLLAVVLPWVHTKFIPLAAAGLVFTLLRPYRWRVRAASGIVFAVSLALLSGYFRSHYGSASFSAALGPADVSLRRIPWGAAGALFDRQYGLLVVAPVLALAIPGAVVLWRRRTGDALRALAFILLVLLPAAAYVGWWGGAAPPARYVLPLVGPMLLAAAMAAPVARDALAALGGMGLVILGLAADGPRMLRNRPDGESLLLRALAPDVDVNAWLPSFVEGGAAAPLLAVSMVAAGAIAWYWHGRGVIVALAAYALLAGGIHDRPVIDRAAATQRLLWTADGVGALRGLAIPFELPRRPWTLDPGEGRNSRRMLLPPGAYQVEVRTRALEAPAHVRLEVHAGELALAQAETHGGGTVRFPVFLPAGGRGLGASAYGVAGRGEVEAITVIPEALVPRARRAGFDWPERPQGDRYRVESSGVRVTVLDRTERQNGGFRVRGEGSFLVEAPAGAAIRMTVTRAAGSIEAKDIDTAGAVTLGRVAVLPLRVREQDAVITLALGGR